MVCAFHSIAGTVTRSQFCGKNNSHFNQTQELQFDSKPRLSGLSCQCSETTKLYNYQVTILHNSLVFQSSFIYLTQKHVKRRTQLLHQ